MLHQMTTPVQKRSVRSLEKILGAARLLVARGNFDEASIADIVELAGLSVGAFYARFKDKEALFHELQIRMIAELQVLAFEQIDTYVAAHRSNGTRPSLPELADFVTRALVDLYNHSPGLLRAVYLHTRVRRDEVLLARISTFNLQCIERSQMLVGLLKLGSDRTEVYAAWGSAIGVIGTYLREQILFGSVEPDAQHQALDQALKTTSQMLVSFMEKWVK